MTIKKEMRNQNDIDFEIRFIEGIIKKRPDFIEALVALGDLYTKKGLYQRGLEIDEKLSKLRPDDPVILYNLACSYSLVNDIDRSLQVIKLAIGSGYRDIGYLECDSDLNNLRQDSRFQQYISEIKKETSKGK